MSPFRVALVAMVLVAALGSHPASAQRGGRGGFAGGGFRGGFVGPRGGVFVGPRGGVRLCAAGFQSRLCRATWWRLLSAGLRLGWPWLPGWCLRRPWLRRRPVALVVGWLGTAAATAALVGVGTAAAMGLGTAPLVRLPELPAATSDASRACAFAARIFPVAIGRGAVLAWTNGRLRRRNEQRYLCAPEARLCNLLIACPLTATGEG